MNINDLNSGPVISYMRPALIIGAETIGFEWIDIDGTGAVPEIWNWRERCTEAGAAIAVYREPNDNLGASRYQLMRELVAIAEGAPEVDGMRAEQMRELRRALEEAHGRAEAARESFVHQQRVTESAIVQARRWKRQATAAQAEAEALHATITSAETRARIATTDRDVLEAKLDGTIAAKNAATMERNEARDELEQARKNALDVITRVAACLPMPDAITDAAVIEPGFQIDSYFGAEDNIPVVQIDTIGMNGRCRVNLNDGVIWDGDPEHDERPGSNAEPLEHEQTEPVTEITRAEIREITVTQDRDGAGFISLEVGAVDSAAVFASVDHPSPIACGHDPRDAAHHTLEGCQQRLAMTRSQAEAWGRVLDHPAMAGALDDKSMTMNQAVGYRLTELANIEQKWNAQNAAAAPDHMPPTPQGF